MIFKLCISACCLRLSSGYKHSTLSTQKCLFPLKRDNNITTRIAKWFIYFFWGNIHFESIRGRCRTCFLLWIAQNYIFALITIFSALNCHKWNNHHHFITFFMFSNKLKCVPKYGTPLQMTTKKLYRKYILLVHERRKK